MSRFSMKSPFQMCFFVIVFFGFAVLHVLPITSTGPRKPGNVFTNIDSNLFYCCSPMPLLRRPWVFYFK